MTDKPFKNKVTIQDFNKFNKMSLENFELNKERHIIDLNQDNYEYLYAIKSGELSKYSTKESVDKLKILSKYFFGTIPVRTQKALLQLAEKTPLKLPHEDFPDEYVRYLNAMIYFEHLVP